VLVVVPPVDVPPSDVPPGPPEGVPPAPPTNGPPIIVHPLGGPGRPDEVPPDPSVPPFGEPAPEGVLVVVPPVDVPPSDVPPGPPEGVPPAPPTNGPPIIVHPLGGPGRPDEVPPDPSVPPFGEPAPAGLMVSVSPPQSTALTATAIRVAGRVGRLAPDASDAALSQETTLTALRTTSSIRIRRRS
jgi:hypothetical protein